MDMLSMVSSAMGDPNPPKPKEVAAKEVEEEKRPSHVKPDFRKGLERVDTAAVFLLDASSPSSTTSSPVSSSPFMPAARSPIFARPTSSLFAPSPTSSSPLGKAAFGEKEQEKKLEEEPQAAAKLSLKPTPATQPQPRPAQDEERSRMAMLGLQPHRPSTPSTSSVTSSQGDAGENKGRNRVSGGANPAPNLLQDFGGSSIFNSFVAPPKSGARPVPSSPMAIKSLGQSIEDMKTVSLSQMGAVDFFDASSEPVAAPTLGVTLDGVPVTEEELEEQRRRHEEEKRRELEEEEFSDSDIDDAVEEAVAELSVFTGLTDRDIVGEEEWLVLEELQGWQAEVSWLLKTELLSLIEHLSTEVESMREDLLGINEMVSFKSRPVALGNPKEPQFMSRLTGFAVIKGCNVSEAEVDVKLTRDGRKHGFHFASKIAQGDHNNYMLPQLQDACNYLELCLSHLSDLRARQQELQSYFQCDHADEASCTNKDALHHRTNHSDAISLSSNAQLLEDSNAIRGHILADVARATKTVALMLMQAKTALLRAPALPLPLSVIGLNGPAKEKTRLVTKMAPQYTHFKPRPPPELCIDLSLEDAKLKVTAVTLQVTAAMPRYKATRQRHIGYTYEVDNLWVEIVDCEEVLCDVLVVPDVVRRIGSLYSTSNSFRAKVTALEA